MQQIFADGWLIVHIRLTFEALTCEYACVFGISYNVMTIQPGHNNTVYRHGSSFLILSGKNGTVYWFYFEKLDKKYAVPNIPRYTEEDAIKTCETQLDTVIADNVTFRELWINRKSAIKVALEEGIMRRWHYGRFVLLGDAAHKVIVRRINSSFTQSSIR
jgi:FAD dependent monooxygenase